MTDFYIDPDPSAFRAFAELPSGKPINILNLIQYRKEAAYEDGQIASGSAAYEAYAQHSAPFFAAAGGKIVWAGRPQAVLIGAPDEHWDHAFIASYPSKDHFVNMVRDKGYQAIVHHRAAALMTSRLICFEPYEMTIFS